MSVLWQRYPNNRLLIKYGLQSICAYSSRRSTLNDAESFFKSITEKLKSGDDEIDGCEGGPNWELFNPKGNRFYLPNSVGLAWQNRKTVGTNFDVDELVNFKTTNSTQNVNKFHFSCRKCPALIREKIEDLFPVENMMMITLSYKRDTEIEVAAKNFVLAASEICRRLKADGNWADFWNPFSGKPFYNSFNVSHQKTLAEKDAYQFGIRYENLNNCMVMVPDVKHFSGSIFTDAPYSPTEMKRMVQILRLKELLAMFDGLNNKEKF